MPRIKDVTPALKQLTQDIETSNDVKAIYVWGSYARHKNDPNYRIADLDLLVETNIHSEDLVSVDRSALTGGKTAEDLMDEGFDPAAVEFSQKLAALESPLNDFWAISKNKRLLHWGPIFPSKMESESLKEDAQSFAEQQTGVSTSQIRTSSTSKRENWYDEFHRYYIQQMAEMPSGWYESEENNVKAIITSAIKI